jgi:hypothetical protein
LIQKIKNFEFQSVLPLTLSNFLHHYNIPIQAIYKRGSWKRLCNEAGKLNSLDGTNEKEITRAIGNKWLSTSCNNYFAFILKLAKNNFKYPTGPISKEEEIMLLMLHYDIWQNPGGFDSLEESINAIGNNPQLVQEIIEVMDFLLDKIDFIEKEIDLPYSQPLKLHGRYTREQILTAFAFSNFDKKASNREGVANNKELNTELLFIDLIKSEEDFSPTTMYNDYAVSDTLFHWQSQNATSPESSKGMSYISHEASNKHILLFIREKSTDQYGNTMGYVFVGDGKLKDYYGSKPMSINWQLSEPIPNYLWKESAKLAVG